MKKAFASVAALALLCASGMASAQNSPFQGQGFGPTNSSGNSGGQGGQGGVPGIQELTGDTKLACEAILCLSTGQRPSECMPSIQRYFSIKFRKPGDTLRARINFLNQCPVSNQTPEMQSLVAAIGSGAGNCDAQSLNSALRSYNWTTEQQVISNKMPNYCAAYTGHQYTDFSSTLPRYVGLPERGGQWVEAQDYDRALAAYNERIKREDEERRQQEQNARRYDSTY